MVQILFISIFALIILKPVSMFYMLLIYLFTEGLMHPEFMKHFVLTYGSVNISILQIIFVSMLLSLMLQLIKSLIRRKKPMLFVFSKEQIVITIMLILYLAIHSVIFIDGLFDNVPFDKLVSYSYLPMQSLYFFAPLLMISDEKQCIRLLCFLMILSFIFPIGQAFLINDQDTLRILSSQGIIRLGYGTFSCILAFSILSSFSFDRRLYYIILPAVGLIMLGHRSAYISIFISIMTVGFLKGLKSKTLLKLGAVGTAVIAVLFLYQSITSAQVYSSSMKRMSETFQETRTTTGRVQAIKDTIHSIEDCMFLGLGYKKVNLLEKTQEWNSTSFNIIHPHNFIMKSLSMSGILGTLILCMIIFYSILTNYRMSRNKYTDQDTKNIFIYLLSTIMFFIIFSSMNTTFERDGYIFWMMAGFSIFILNKNKNIMKSR